MSVYPPQKLFPTDGVGKDIDTLYQSITSLVDNSSSIPWKSDEKLLQLLPSLEALRGKISSSSSEKSVEADGHGPIQLLVDLSVSLVSVLSSTVKARESDLVYNTEQHDILEETIQVLEQQKEELSLEVNTLETRNHSLQARVEDHKREALRLSTALSRTELELAQKKEPEKEVQQLRKVLREKNLEQDAIRQMYSPDKAPSLTSRRFSSGTRLAFSPRSPRNTRTRRGSSHSDYRKSSDEGSDEAVEVAACECKAKVKRLHNELQTLRRTSRAVGDEVEATKVQLEIALEGRAEAEAKLSQVSAELDELRDLARSYREHSTLEGVRPQNSPSISEPFESLDGWETMLNAPAGPPSGVTGERPSSSGSALPEPPRLPGPKATGTETEEKGAPQPSVATQTQVKETKSMGVQTNPLPKLKRPPPTKFAKVMATAGTQTEHVLRIVRGKTEELTIETEESLSLRAAPSKETSARDASGSEATISSGEAEGSSVEDALQGEDAIQQEDMVRQEDALVIDLQISPQSVSSSQSPASSLSPVSRGEFGELLVPGSRMQFVIRGRMLLKQTWLKARRKWQHRYLEMEGPTISVYQNASEVKPLLKIPLDGVEVRIVKGSLKTSSKSRSHKNRSVIHEFFIWHPKRQVYQLSAPSEPELYRWVEAIQMQCTSVSIRPRRAGASYLRFRGTRYFAVLRDNGIYFYGKSTDNVNKDLILVDTNCQVRKSNSNSRDFIVWHRSRGTQVVSADSEEDCSWWIDSLSAHALGVVSWGALFGLNEDGFGVKTF